MRVLRSKETTPPGGWYFIQPDTGETITGASFPHLSQMIAEYRLKRGLPAGEPSEELEVQTCVRLGDSGGYCEDKIRGIGDVVSKFAQPVARVIDTIAGTRIQSCGGCAARRAAMNRALPL